MKKYLFVFLMGVISTLTAQKKRIYDRSNTKMSHDDVRCVTTDLDGNVYFGTSGFGLVKFDGEKCKNFGTMHPDVGHHISFLFTDSKGNIWIRFTQPYEELVRFNGKEWKVIDEEFTGIEFGSTFSITEDSKGTIYIGCDNKILIYDGQRWSDIKFKNKNVLVKTISVSDDGKIAIGNQKGVVVIENNQWKEYTKEDSQLQLSVVLAVKYIGDKLFIGYGGGLGDGGFSIVENNEWKHYNKQNSKLKDHSVRDFERDTKGNIWIATGEGVVKMKGDKIKPILFRRGKVEGTCFDVCVYKNKVYIASTFGLFEVTNKE